MSLEEKPDSEKALLWGIAERYLIMLIGCFQRNPASNSDAIEEARVKLARETIRLMEWARRVEMKRNYGVIFATDEIAPLTLPPQDWKP